MTSDKVPGPENNDGKLLYMLHYAYGQSIFVLAQTFDNNLNELDENNGYLFMDLVDLYKLCLSISYVVPVSLL